MREILIDLIAGIVLFFLLSFILMILWNICIPDIFGFNSIDYWQSTGLCLISWILFRTNVSVSKK